MNLFRTHKNGHHRGDAGGGSSVPVEQLPTTATKATVAAVVTVLGLVGIHVTTGTAQLIVMAGQLLLVVYGVWRAHNRPKLPNRGRDVSGYFR